MSADDRIFRVEARLKNNRLVKARQEAGFPTVTAAAQAIGVAHAQLCSLETLRDLPRGPRGWTPTALKIAAFYGHPPEHLWPDALGAVQKREAVLELSEAQVGRLLPAPRAESPYGLLAGKEGKELLGKVLEVLTPREWEIVRQRFDETPATHAEIGKAQGRSRGRIQQIEQQALAKLDRYLDRNPETKDALLEALRQGAFS